MPKSATERLNQKKQAKKVVLEKDFAGIKAGQKMLVATPKMIAEYMNNIPPGQTRTIHRLRNDLARKNQCDASCPVSTAIFIRIAAQAAIEDLETGKAVNTITPFWRVLAPTDKITKKLTIDADWIARQRSLEA